MAMYNLDLFSNDDVAKDGEEGEDGRKGGFAVDDEKRDMVDFEAIREIAHASSPFVCVRYDDDFVSSVDELGGELVDVTLDSSGLGEEEVADHGDIIWHCGELERSCCGPAGQHNSFVFRREDSLWIVEWEEVEVEEILIMLLIVLWMSRCA
jgi:hypothetical protein